MPIGRQEVKPPEYFIANVANPAVRKPKMKTLGVLCTDRGRFPFQIERFAQIARLACPEEPSFQIGCLSRTVCSDGTTHSSADSHAGRSCLSVRHSLRAVGAIHSPDPHTIRSILI